MLGRKKPTKFYVGTENANQILFWIQNYFNPKNPGVLVRNLSLSESTKQFFLLSTYFKTFLPPCSPRKILLLNGV